MPDPFDFFVILGDMRTGSNLLEARLDAYRGIDCYGEVFNPGFIGKSGQAELLGITVDERDKRPLAVIDALRKNAGRLAGFRLFPGHDPRVLEHCLREKRCAKIVLSRNPLDSYVSLKIARRTGQWWLGEHGKPKTARIAFDALEFDRFLRTRQEFYDQVRLALQTSGQAPFHVHYDDLSNDAVIDGLVRYLGLKPHRESADSGGRVQNPEPLDHKVTNFEDVEPALARIDYFDVFRHPDFEPRRSANIPKYHLSSAARLVFTPIAGGPTEAVLDWLGRAGGAPPVTGASQKELRQWKRQHPGHRSFAVLSHPAERAHRAFCDRVLATDRSAFHEIRKVLSSRYGVALPEDPSDPSYGPDEHRRSFLKFLDFLRANLSGQTSVRVPAVWASQETIVRGLSDFVAPDLLLRSETLAEDLERLSAAVGIEPVEVRPAARAGRFTLGQIYDDEIEKAARAAYQRDYMLFGYRSWGDPG